LRRSRKKTILVTIYINNPNKVNLLKVLTLRGKLICQLLPINVVLLIKNFENTQIGIIISSKQDVYVA